MLHGGLQPREIICREPSQRLFLILPNLTEFVKLKSKDFPNNFLFFRWELTDITGKLKYGLVKLSGKVGEGEFLSKQSELLNKRERPVEDFLPAEGKTDPLLFVTSGFVGRKQAKRELPGRDIFFRGAVKTRGR